ncbi:MAG: hypothetical protein NZ958_00395 [Bacteroidia bacterium]|nr:hypothetical protein [Bacteroidia bacterium]MDW8088150.1 hypothetical protein [Bacteroidia bacterium]
MRRLLCLLIGTGSYGVWGQVLQPPKRCKGSQCAERVRQVSKPPDKRAARRAERFSLRFYTPRHKPLWREEALSPPLPAVEHRPRAERFFLRPPRLRHAPAPEGELYALPRLQHRRVPQEGCLSLPSPPSLRAEKQACAPPRLLHSRLEVKYRCDPPRLTHRRFDRYTCVPSPSRHQPQSPEQYKCPPSPDLSRRNFEQWACPPLPSIRHKNFDRFACQISLVAHRSPREYKVPCDALRQGTLSPLQRLGHDLRYLFTNHRKHCQLLHAYSGVSIGEWVNTQTYGRVVVAGYVMGKRAYRLAHFYDRKGNPLKKPRIEKRTAWAVKQFEVWVPDSSRRRPGELRYMRGLPGIEGFVRAYPFPLVKKRLSVEETKAIQIEKLVRKRKIAWLVRAYPEERVRLAEWIRKYAGPKPPHFWPGIPSPLLEFWQ